MHIWVKFVFEMRFWGYLLEKRQEHFSLRSYSFLGRAYEVFIKVLLFQETCPFPKKSWLRTCNFQLFILNFFLISGFFEFTHLQKINWWNISLVFSKPKVFCLVLFWRKYKVVRTYKYLHYKLWLVLFWSKYWDYNLC